MRRRFRKKYILFEEAPTYFTIYDHWRLIVNYLLYHSRPLAPHSDVFLRSQQKEAPTYFTIYGASIKEVPRSLSRSTFSALKIRECTRYKV